jgi:hypothetical protein
MILYETELITIETVSAIACFILLIFMAKPFRLTRETRYLGLPLGFGFLGASYAISAVSYSPLINFSNWGWIQLFIRGFAFLFLATTYYFSKSKKKPKLLWNATIGIITAMLTILILFAIISPQVSRPDFVQYYIFVQFASLICLCYIIIHGLKNHIEQLDPTTIVIPLGYVFLAMEHYSSLIWVVEWSYLALFGGLVFRLLGLAFFLFVTYRTFYSSEKRENK